MNDDELLVLTIVHDGGPAMTLAEVVAYERTGAAGLSRPLGYRRCGVALRDLVEAGALSRCRRHAQATTYTFATWPRRS